MSTTTVMITGAAGGLGFALSAACARKGFNTVMIDCDRRGLENAHDRIAEKGLPEPVLHPMDLSGAGPDDFDDLLAGITNEFGGLDAVVHCAARFEGLTPLEQIAPQEWLTAIQVNLNAAWLLSARSLPLLRNAEPGRLYFLLENLPRMEGPYWGGYGVAKHALRALAKQFAAECGTSGIQVLGINPGPMRSALRSRAYHAENPALQPDPDTAANRIMDFLTGASVPENTIVDLESA
ncbi:MAG: SDR family NAD(P)-dependent oxidoreductase [Xanthomonadales bacterium]|nr:SDR family NAD(P)-dependent oxidoreductase [Gammaproteobacteria bacterium]MBT8055024.1 SDR family NAD(P)-dependent oxidoreductase [Gammaproteobacteria bacterium]NND56406.1 SDR family NAD(P)-dependent oxidoreductase [Xanthomonadales bacterium]NNK50463.1 SDR family NAD(P)-dependent oxidoreductase [Xanthomonadales bacterium]